MTGADDHFDAEVDAVIQSCLDLENPRSFFLYAGAGSGKTRSLVDAIRSICDRQGRRLAFTGQKVGVITYTNAACDEIKQRLEFNPRVEVSTIHSFAWSLISGNDVDIRQWLTGKLRRDLEELRAAQAKSRGPSKTSMERARLIESKTRRLERLGEITHFVYSPTGDNRSRDSLSHGEVMAMTAHFLVEKPGLRRLLVSRFPILLIDESQDTNGNLMDALLDVEREARGTFCLGLFGDTMQRIYADGKVGLAEAIPEDWAKPRKRMNHRCPRRVIELINNIRRDDDGVEQQPRSDAEDGIVRLFIVPRVIGDKTTVETEITSRMAKITGDENWVTAIDETNPNIKTLALEHMMSAKRFQFDAFFGPLYSFRRHRTSLLQGSGAGIGLFTREILPLVQALRASDDFAVATLLRRTSPLLVREVLEQAGENQVDVLRTAKAVCEGLLELVSAQKMPTARAVLGYVSETGLFRIPDALVPFTSDALGGEGEYGSVLEELMGAIEIEEKGDVDQELEAWRAALEAPFDQIERYDRYVRGISRFDTHQGVKGREFPRVMVVLSDEEANGFLFSFDKLMGAKGKSKIDLDHEAAGEETSIDRTRRLFYVTCSRAEQSLAVVYYTGNPHSERDTLIRKGWFTADEIELVN